MASNRGVSPRSSPRHSSLSQPTMPMMPMANPYMAAMMGQMQGHMEAEHNDMPFPEDAKQLNAGEIIWKMAQGNKRYVAGQGSTQKQSGKPLVEMLIDDPLRPKQVEALVISCARSFAPLLNIFDAEPGQVQNVRVCGAVCDPQDGVVGSVEFALGKEIPPVLIVMANSKNCVVEAAVRVALNEAGRSGMTPPYQMKGGRQEEDLTLVKAVLPAAKDAILQMPTASFEKLCEVAAKLNAWKSIEVLLSTSRTIFDAVNSGVLQVHGAYYDVDSYKVQFLGEHPSKAALMAESLRPPAEAVRTAGAPKVLAEEALALVYAGNRRYASGKADTMKITDERLLTQLAESGQNPIAIILGCADSRAPIEILFDVQPGDLFVLRNAGNTVAASAGSIIGSAEYAMSHLGTRLVVITGHTKCGAVTAAVDAVRNNKTIDCKSSIGQVLDQIVNAATQAVQIMPNAEIPDQVKLATKINVFQTIEKILQHSEVTRKLTETSDVQINGSVYDIFSGSVEWLGEHPDLERIMGKPLGMYQWRTQPYVRAPPVHMTAGPNTAAAALDKLRVGNMRFTTGVCQPVPRGTYQQDPYAIVLAGAEVRVPIEKIFDVGPGDLVIQRSMGSLFCRYRASLFASIEYAVARFMPKVLVVLVESESSIVKEALKAISGAEAPSPGMRSVIDRVMVSALRATVQVNKEKPETAAGKEMKLQQLCVELNGLYTIERLIKSDMIRNCVMNHGLELHCAVLNQHTGEVDFIGQHPMHDILVRDAEQRGKK